MTQAKTNENQRSTSGEIQGEGNPKAGREYQERTRAFVEGGHVSEAANEAKRAMSKSEERSELERAREDSKTTR